MGTKRTVDTGRKDTQGRAIKVAETRRAAATAGAQHTSPSDDFATEVARPNFGEPTKLDKRQKQAIKKGQYWGNDSFTSEQIDIITQRFGRGVGAETICAYKKRQQCSRRPTGWLGTLWRRHHDFHQV